MISNMRHLLCGREHIGTALLFAAACAASSGRNGEAQQPLAPVTATPETFTVQTSGSGRPVIFIPGVASPGSVWDSIVAQLPGTEAHVLTLAGFAGAPAADSRPILETVATELAAYIRQHSLERPVIVGHSLGGTLALMIGAAEPELVGPLVIVDALPYFPAVINPAATPEVMRTQAAMMRDQVSRQTQAEFAAAQASYFPMNVTDSAHVAMLQAVASKSDPATVGQAMYELMTTDVRPALPKIRVPLFVFGSWAMYGSRAQVLQNFETQLAGVPGARITLSESGRHFLMYDDPATLLRIIRDALAH